MYANTILKIGKKTNIETDRNKSKPKMTESNTSTDNDVQEEHLQKLIPDESIILQTEEERGIQNPDETNSVSSHCSSINTPKEHGTQTNKAKHEILSKIQHLFDEVRISIQSMQSKMSSMSKYIIETPEELERNKVSLRNERARNARKHRVGLVDITLSRRPNLSSLIPPVRQEGVATSKPKRNGPPHEYSHATDYTNDEETERDVADALDVLRAMTFNMAYPESEDGSNDHEVEDLVYLGEHTCNDNKHKQCDELITTTSSDNSPILSCLTNDGKLHIFPIFELLCPVDTNKNTNVVPITQTAGGTAGVIQKFITTFLQELNSTDDSIGNGFTSLLMGKDLTKTLEMSTFPLCNPISTVNLSVSSGIVDEDLDSNHELSLDLIPNLMEELAFKKNLKAPPRTNEEGSEGKISSRHNDSNNINDAKEIMKSEVSMKSSPPTEENPFDQASENSVESRDLSLDKHLPSTYIDDGSDHFLNRPFDLALFDANIEPTTARFRTEKNIPTICISSFNYVAVGGRGTRKVRRRVKKRKLRYFSNTQPPQNMYTTTPTVENKDDHESKASNTFADIIHDIENSFSDMHGKLDGSMKTIVKQVSNLVSNKDYNKNQQDYRSANEIKDLPLSLDDVKVNNTLKMLETNDIQNQSFEGIKIDNLSLNSSKEKSDDHILQGSKEMSFTGDEISNSFGSEVLNSVKSTTEQKSHFVTNSNPFDDESDHDDGMEDTIEQKPKLNLDFVSSAEVTDFGIVQRMVNPSSFDRSASGGQIESKPKFSSENPFGPHPNAGITKASPFDEFVEENAGQIDSKLISFPSTSPKIDATKLNDSPGIKNKLSTNPFDDSSDDSYKISETENTDNRDLDIDEEKSNVKISDRVSQNSNNEVGGGDFTQNINEDMNMINKEETRSEGNTENQKDDNFVLITQSDMESSCNSEKCHESTETIFARHDDEYAWEWDEFHVPGGFLSLISTKYLSEVRTIFLPFVPKIISPVHLDSMQFVIVLGQTSKDCLAIRVDTDPNPKEARITSSKDLWREAKTQASISTSPLFKRHPYLRRFAPIPIVIDEDVCHNNNTIKQTPVAITSTNTSPPSILLCQSTSSKEIISLRSLIAVQRIYSTSEDKLDARYQLLTSNDKRQNAYLSSPLENSHSRSTKNLNEQNNDELKHKTVTCFGGQGWSCIGLDYEEYFDLFFITWEGATTSNGAHSTFLSRIDKNVSINSPLSKMNICAVTPISARHEAITSERKRGQHNSNSSFPLSIPSSYQLPYNMNKNGDITHNNGFESSHKEDVVLDAIQSIREFNHRENGILSPLDYLNTEVSASLKSQALLQHCNSWTQLEDTKENRALLDYQVPVVYARLPHGLDTFHCLTLRKNVVDNGITTPFKECLAWLCQKRDYYTAALIALHLLQDLEAVRDLQKTNIMSGDKGEVSSTDELLDGITKLDAIAFKNIGKDHDSIDSKKQNNITSLADMAVGCMVRGGAVMAHTLDGYLSRNGFYDASRASLMLVAASSRIISDLKSESVTTNFASNSYDPLKSEAHTLWPIQCLLQIAVTRDCMHMALTLLNVTIPNELRNLNAMIPNELSNEESGKDESVYRMDQASLDLCQSIVRMILASAPYAPRLLLNLTDEFSNEGYWLSLKHETRLALSLISIKGVFPLLREFEVREWASTQMNTAIKKSTDTTCCERDDETLSSQWIRDVCFGCLYNAGCNVSQLQTKILSRQDESNGNDDGIEIREYQERLILKSLKVERGKGGIDFNLLIPSLLLLVRRSQDWSNGSCISTQSLLNIVCDLAGRRTSEEPRFGFDGGILMKQCGVAENMVAAAFLIGGHDGYILKCVNILVKNTGLNVDDAESWLLDTKNDKILPNNEFESCTFQLTNVHRELLWLLHKHVMVVKKYGDFYNNDSRGKLDPIFACRCILRAWYCLMLNGFPESCGWLVSWLGKKLKLNDNSTYSNHGKSLACAVLARALLWPQNDVTSDDNMSSQVLADVMGFDMNFLVTLCKNCCGLVESIPPSLAKNIATNDPIQKFDWHKRPQ